MHHPCLITDCFHLPISSPAAALLCQTDAGLWCDMHWAAALAKPMGCTLLSTYCLKKLSSSLRGASVPKYSSSDCKQRLPMLILAFHKCQAPLAAEHTQQPCIQWTTVTSQHCTEQRSLYTDTHATKHVIQDAADRSVLSTVAQLLLTASMSDLLQVSRLPVRLLTLGSCPLALVQHAAPKVILAAFIRFLLNCLHESWL